MITARGIALIGKIPGINRVARWYAAQYAEGSVVKIKHGRAAGLLWCRHHRYVHGYWIGQYELFTQDALQRELRAGDTFFDVGANAGFFILVAARLVGEGGRCIAIEPLPENCKSIHEQIKVNSLPGCLVVDEAVSDTAGTVPLFFSSHEPSMAHLGAARRGERELLVRATTLDSLCARFGCPDFIKMDIEGAEARALRGAVHTLQHLRPGWLIELHGPECGEKTKAILQEARYTFFSLAGSPLDPDSPLPEHFIARPAEKEGE